MFFVSLVEILYLKTYMQLDDVPGLSPRDKAQCRRAGYHSSEQLLIDNLATLASNLKASDSEALCIRTCVLKAVAPPTKCMWDLVRDDIHAPAQVPGSPIEDDYIMRHEDADPDLASSSLAYTPPVLSTGDRELDKCIGGLYRGTVTEISGESSSGKTQLVLGIATCTALGIANERAGRERDPHNMLDGGQGHHVAILCTHGQSVARQMVGRMIEIAHSVIEQVCAARGSIANSGAIVSAMLANVHMAHALTFEAAEHVLSYTLPGLAARNVPVSLFVMDSVVSVMSDDVLEDTSIPRSMRVHAIADLLKRLAAGNAESSGMSVLVTNHVNDAFPGECALVERAFATGELPVPRHSTMQAPPDVLNPEQVLPVSALEQGAHVSGLYASVPCGDSEHVVTQARASALKTAQLGIAWSNLVNTRLLLSTHPRRLRVVFSPHCAPGEVYLSIARSGIQANPQLSV